MYRVALESVLGFDLRPGEIRLRPCIPAAWPGFRIRYRVPGAATVYDLAVERANDGGTSSGEVDGQRLEVGPDGVRIPLADDGREHSVRIALGRDVVPRYSPRPA
jgi:cyclic beta-1,2-glucan synthetase